MKKQPLYLKITDLIEEHIQNGSLRCGDRLPSIREIQKLHKVSINTVKAAFLELEAMSLVESRPRLGYFVSRASQRKSALPSIGELNTAGEDHPQDLIDKVFTTLKSKEITRFSLGTPAKSFLPIAKLNKTLIKTVQKLEDGGTGYEPAQGSENLRRTIARWSMEFEGRLTADDLVTTSGTMNAIFNCLFAVTQRGDTVAIESPVYFGTIQVAKSLGLNVIEIPSHPVTGVDLDALKKLLHKIDVCCFTTSFSNPLGSLMPEEHKRELVAMLAKHHIPLIEDDLYGNLFYDNVRPKPCKAFDEEGLVMWCSSVSKTLAPGYRVGWVAPGQFKEKIIRQKLFQTISTPLLYQEVIADFMEHGRYELHLRTFRNRLYSNCLQFQHAIEDYFPENTKVSQPKGGFVLWLEFDKGLDTAKLYDLAIKNGISYAPGRIFTLQNQYHNCMRLNYALDWNSELELKLKTLGSILKNGL